MFRDDNREKRFSNAGFEWAPQIGFDHVVPGECQHGRPHVGTAIDIQLALRGPWEPVIIADIDGCYIYFVTREGCVRMWSHNPEMLADFVEHAEEAHEAWWSKEYGYIAATSESLTVLVGLAEGTATECSEVREPEE